MTAYEGYQAVSSSINAVRAFDEGRIGQGFLNLGFAALGTLGFASSVSQTLRGFRRPMASGIVDDAAHHAPSPTTSVNPRLVQRLQAWRTYKSNGGTMGMAQWVKHTQGARWGTGFKSGYGAWIRRIESTHGNSILSRRTAYLYRLEDAGGNLLKWGVTQDMGTRYSAAFMADKKLVRIAQGRRADMLRLERDFVETYPGPLNNERWAGARIGGW